MIQDCAHDESGAFAEPFYGEDDGRAPRVRHVMIIEDNADVRDALRWFLEASGHRVDVAEDGLQGVKRALDVRPEVVLVDIGLPELDGYGVARALRAALGAQILLAALTGYGHADARIRARAAGFDAHLLKPVTLEALERLLRCPSPLG